MHNDWLRLSQGQKGPDLGVDISSRHDVRVAATSTTWWYSPTSIDFFAFCKLISASSFTFSGTSDEPKNYANAVVRLSLVAEWGVGEVWIISFLLLDEGFRVACTWVVCRYS